MPRLSRTALVALVVSASSCSCEPTPEEMMAIREAERARGEEARAKEEARLNSIRKLPGPQFRARLLMCAQCNRVDYNRYRFAQNCERIYRIAHEKEVEIPPLQACDD